MINPKTGRAIKVGSNVNKRLIKSEEVKKKREVKKSAVASEPPKVPKKRGRPVKSKPSGYNDPMLLSDVKAPSGKKRGRPKGSKNKPKGDKVKNMIVPKYLLKNY